MFRSHAKAPTPGRSLCATQYMKQAKSKSDTEPKPNIE